MRLLHRHAHQGRPRDRRDRAADLRAARLAGDALLHRQGACRAGLHRGGDPAGPGPCAGHGVRRGGRGVLTGRDRRAGQPACRDQRLEHGGGQHPHLGARDVRAVSPLTAAARRFRAAHHGPRPLVLPNVWDAVSARVFAEAGFGALATSSGAVADALGYADGQRTPAAEMFAAIARITRSVDVPVTADVEAGYGLAPGELAGPGRQADYLTAVHTAAGEALVINARVDVFVRPRPEGGGDAVEEAVERARRYLEAGADCCYPILAPLEALTALVADIDGPVNAMCRPGGPSLAELTATGVARITFCCFIHQQAT